MESTARFTSWVKPGEKKESITFWSGKHYLYCPPGAGDAILEFLRNHCDRDSNSPKNTIVFESGRHLWCAQRKGDGALALIKCFETGSGEICPCGSDKGKQNNGVIYNRADIMKVLKDEKEGNPADGKARNVEIDGVNVSSFKRAPDDNIIDVDDDDDGSGGDDEPLRVRIKHTRRV